ncbi:MAG TPA: lysine--tRNA ligase [Candidatus Paceibacterota bacterium]|jgi:lysyl-tRNA synthetase class 2|nr:lysine--tRNA ligase [Candidatus Paceibacterota bacterium]
MASIEELRADRLKKKALLIEKGINPYPAETHRTDTIEVFLDRFSLYEEGKDTITLAGRVMSKRGQGGITFCDLYDGTAKVQAFFKADEMDATVYELFNDTVDIGDFIEVTGAAYTTQRGAPSIFVSGWGMLSKSLRPIPDAWYGLKDDDERYRKRYLDILQNQELHDLFIKKAKFWQGVRKFLIDEGFLEVETPTLEVTTGGAEARPFQAHHNDFDMDVYLRISVGELWQKRLLAAGFPRTFEVGRVYRNEGSSSEHLQEFTNVELYAAYMDYNKGIELTERMIKTIVEETFGTLQFTSRGYSFDLSQEQWKRIPYVDTVLEMTGINVLEATEEEMKNKLQELGVAYEGANRERLTDTLWKYCRKQIAGPVWLVDVPKIVSPLAKAKPENPLLTERVQLIVAGAECSNGFSELNDPIDQAERFAAQKKLIEEGDEEAMMPDDEFVEMLEHGMPPAFGFGMGERFFAFLVDKPLRETQLFPLLKPKNE